MAHPLSAGTTTATKAAGLIRIGRVIAALTTVTVAPGATPGPREVVITNPGPYGNAAAYCFGCLTVT